MLDEMGVELPKGLSRYEALRRIQQEFPDAADRRLLLLRLRESGTLPLMPRFWGSPRSRASSSGARSSAPRTESKSDCSVSAHELGIATEDGR